MNYLIKIKNLLSRMAKQTKQFPKDCKSFGIKPACYIWFDRVFLGLNKQKYISVIQEFMDNYLADLAHEYQSKPVLLPEAPSVNTAWCCWWSGEETMPEIVKMCVNSIRASLPDGVRCILITEKNYNDYVEIPDYIMEKVSTEVINITAFSDILRVCLLSRHGGFWIDATVCIPEKLPKDYFERTYFTQKFPSAMDCPNEACLGKWAGFLQCGIAEFPLFSFARDAFFKWWKEHDYLIDYVILDYILMSGYNLISQYQKIIDAVPPNNTRIWGLQKILSSPYDETEFEALTSSNLFHKLARTLTPPKEVDGKPTVYGYLCQKYL